MGTMEKPLPTPLPDAVPQPDRRVLERRSYERREHPRVKIEQFCRMIYHGREYPCEVIDVSEGGAGLKTKVVPEVGEAVLLYFDDMGRVRGQIVRHFKGGCGVSFTITQIKRDRVIQRLELLIKNGRTQSLPHERLLLEMLAGTEVITLNEIRGDSLLKRTLDDFQAEGWVEWTTENGIHQIRLTERGRLLGPLPR